jgi:cytochrome c peroxidase
MRLRMDLACVALAALALLIADVAAVQAATKICVSCHGGVAMNPTAGTITGLPAVTCLRMARRPRAAPAQRRAIKRGAAVRRTERRGADHGIFRTVPPPRSVLFQNAQSAVRTATSSAAAPASTATTKRKRP